jgi:chaperone BCS1
VSQLQPSELKDIYSESHSSPSPQTGAWYDPISRPSRRWNSVLLPGSIKDDLLKDVAAFLSDEEQEWYAERGEW